MQASAAGGLDDLVRVDLGEAGDVLGDGAVEELNVLRQVAQMRPQFGAAPACQRQAVEQHLAGNVGPDAHQHACQRGFARAGRSEHDGDGARGGVEAEPLEDGLGPSGRAGDHVAQHHLPGRRHATQGLVAFGMSLQQFFQAQEGAACADETAPGVHHLVDGREGAGHEHVGGDHAAGGQLAVDHQQRACAQREGLLAVAHPLADGVDAVRQGLRSALPRHVIRMALRPACAQAGEHAHGLDHFGVAQLALQVKIDIERGFGCGLRGRDRAPVPEPRQRRLDQRKADRHPAEEGVEEEQHADIDRRPGRVEEGEDAVAGEELPHFGELIERALRRRPRMAEVGLEAGVEHPRAEHRVQPDTGPHQQA